MKRIKYFILLAISLTFILNGCAFTTNSPYTKSAFYFDTVITLSIYSKNSKSILDECFEMCESFENTVSKTISTSEVSRINAAQGKPIKVSDTTIELLNKAIYYSKITNGAFDITINPLSVLWNINENTGIIPSDSDIKNALEHVNYKNIIINENYVTLTDKEASIDLGGIAKGYLADFLKNYLIEKGVKSGILNLGGNVITIGSKPDGSDFKIGIQRPFSEDGTIATTVFANNSSVVTSGIYERYFEIEKEIYHHIIDTNTGYPTKNNLQSVTILSGSSLEGDALSTACMVLGYENALNLIRSIDGVEAIFITDSYDIIDTRTIKK